MTALAAALGAAAASAWALSTVSHCPEGSRPMRTVDSLHPWACVLTSERYQDGVDCPSGTRGVTVADVTSPFKCALEGVSLTAPRGICPPGETAIPSSDPAKDYECEPVGKSFMAGPRCPKGTRPVPTPGALQSFKCVSTPPPADPDPSASSPLERPAPARVRVPAEGPKTPKAVRCPKGTRRVATEDPFEPFQCVPVEAQAPSKLAYRAFRLAGALSFEYPSDWDLTNGWKDEEPAIYMRPGRARDGRPVSLSVTRARRSASGYVDIATRIWQEEDWHGSKETGRTHDAGHLTVRLETAGESRLTLIEADDGYFALAFGAPEDQFASYLPAFERLERTFRDLEGPSR